MDRTIIVLLICLSAISTSDVIFPFAGQGLLIALTLYMSMSYNVKEQSPLTKVIKS